MSDERQGWTQWREGDTLHETRPAWCNDWQAQHTTYFGWFSEHQVRTRQLAAKIIWDEFEKHSILGRFMANKTSEDQS